MTVYIILTVLCLGLAVSINWIRKERLISYRESRIGFLEQVCLWGIGVALFAVSAVRVGIGNDYYKYVEFINRITYHSYVPTEVGFNGIVRICNVLFGKENAVAVFAVIAGLTIFIFLKGIYEQSENFAISFMLFMLLGYYFQSLNTIRYYLALAMVLYSYRYLFTKQYGKFALTILAAFLFHKSAILVLPVYSCVFLLIKIKNKKIKYGIIFLGTVGLIGLGISAGFYLDFYLDILVRLYPSYEGTNQLGGGTSLVNIARCLGVMVLAGIEGIGNRKGIKSENPEEAVEGEFYFWLNYGALFLYLCCSFIPQISRVAYYLTICQLLYIPLLLRRISCIAGWKRFSSWITGMVIAVSICYFALFLHRAKADEIGIVPYHSWLFTETLDYTGTWE